MQRAVAAYQKGDWPEAERLCRQIVDAILNPVRSQPNFAHLHLPQEADGERFLQGLIAAQDGPPPPSRP